MVNTSSACLHVYKTKGFRTNSLREEREMYKREREREREGGEGEREKDV